MDRIHSFKKLANPVAQIAAAEAFCASIRAFFDDHYEGDANIHDINVPTVLDRLACLSLRFETDGCSYEDDGDSFFVWDHDVLPRCLGACLHAYAALVAEDFEESGFIEYPSDDEDDTQNNDGSGERPSMLQVVTLHGCVLDNLVFVPDFEDVVSSAYFLALTPGRLPDDEGPS